MKPGQPFATLPDLAAHLRRELESKKYILLYAYNGTGKTRLSMAFKDIGRQDETRDTLYFNAFTEDLFSWDNDLEDDSDRKLKINSASHFFDGLADMEMDTRIRPLLQRYVDFDFKIDTDEWTVHFTRTIGDETFDDIKISRGEENIFVWCFFLAIVQLAIDGADAYEWVKYIYIDDPISSLDEHNAIAVASHLAQMLKGNDRLRTVISSHHTLFFNVLCNELTKARKYFLGSDKPSNGYIVRETGDTPYFQHVAALVDLCRVAESGTLYTYHFNMLRSILEKTASFHGYGHFSDCIKKDADDPDGVLHTRLVNILSHGKYSLFEPVEMMDENKRYFRKILDDFLKRFPFNPELFVDEPKPTKAP